MSPKTQAGDGSPVAGESGAEGAATYDKAARPGRRALRVAVCGVLAIPVILVMLAEVMGVGLLVSSGGHFEIRNGWPRVVSEAEQLDALPREGRLAAIKPRHDVKPLLRRGEEARAALRPVAEGVNTAVVPVFASACNGHEYGATAFFVDETHLVTANHFAGDAYEITAVIGGRLFRATMVANSVVDDLAVLTVEPSVPHGVLALSRKSHQFGDPVVAVGHPDEIWRREYGHVIEESNLKELPGSSARSRRILKFTAVTRPGDSGGPVLDEKGEVVGVVSSGVEYYHISIATTVAAVDPLMRVAAYYGDAPARPECPWKSPPPTTR